MSGQAILGPMARTTEATINNYKAHCRVAPANEAPITKAAKQRERRLEPHSLPSPRGEGEKMLLHNQEGQDLTTKWKQHIPIQDDILKPWTDLGYVDSGQRAMGATWLEMLNRFGTRAHARISIALDSPAKAIVPFDRLPRTQILTNNFALLSRAVLNKRYPGNPSKLWGRAHIQP